MTNELFCGLGYLADSLGRKAVYGKELMLIIFATIFCISDPTGTPRPLVNPERIYKPCKHILTYAI